MYRLFPLALLWLLPAVCIAAPSALLDKHTQVVVAGVLSWQDRALVQFPTHHRKDRALHALLKKRGVPGDSQNLLLDRQATRAAVLSALDQAAARARPGSTLIFYFAGHGLRQPDGSVVLASWDLKSTRPAATGLPVKLVGQRIAASFRGARVLLLADACYSGGLATVARDLRRARINAAALTSAAASNASTGSWSFTQTLLDGLAGHARQDRNGDGRISLAEVAAEVAEVMKYREGQRHGYDAAPPAGEWLVAKSRGKGKAAPAKWVMVPGSAGPVAARVLARKRSTVQVEAYNYSDYVLAELPAAKVKPLVLKTWAKGARLDVTWNGQVYEAKVLKVVDGFHYITYPGWPSVWDEWVTASRIVGLHRVTAGRGQLSVLWQKQWYPATVLKRKGNKALIHYIGYDKSWDEWVGPERLR